MFVVVMVPASVKVPDGLFMFRGDRFAVVPPPVKVCTPVPEIVKTVVPVEPPERWTIFPFATSEPPLIAADHDNPKFRVPLTVSVVPPAIVSVSPKPPVPKVTLLSDCEPVRVRDWELLLKN